MKCAIEVGKTSYDAVRKLRPVYLLVTCHSNNTVLIPAWHCEDS